MTLPPDTPTPPQTNAQSKTVQKISLLGRAIQGNLIPILIASWVKSELVRKEISTYTDSICRPPSKLPGKQYSLESVCGICGEISPFIEPVYRPPPKPPPRPPDISKISRILSDFDIDLNMDYLYRRD